MPDLRGQCKIAKADMQKYAIWTTSSNNQSALLSLSHEPYTLFREHIFAECTTFHRIATSFHYDGTYQLNT